MIELRNVEKTYNRGKRNQINAIDHTSLTFGEKGLVAILGASGCGKTTLLNVIGGLDKPHSGQIYVNGRRMNSIFSGRTDDIRNANIGYIFQNYHLMDNMTVFENVALVLRMLGIRNKETVQKSVYYVLEKVGLYQYRNRPVDTLSGGERQRVGIARALVKNPGIIIADEPTGNLDSRNSLEVMRIIKAISRDKLVILVTHEKKLANFFADRIIDVVDGKAVNDRENIHNDQLDYHIDNKIYLQDLPVRETLASEKLKLDYISDNSVPMTVRLVVKDGNLFIQCDGRKVDVVDSDSAVELVDDHYKAITQEEAEHYDFDYEKIPRGEKLRYHPINNIFTSIGKGFKTVFGFSAIKKILLLGFVVAAGFMMYAFSSYVGINTVTDDEFITTNKNYVTITNQRNTVSGVESYASLEGVSYAIPGNASVSFMLDFSQNYYQTNQQVAINGALSSTALLTPEDISAGRLPENEKEIVVDRLILRRMVEVDTTVVMLGIPTPEDFLNREVYLSGRTSEKFTIVGISDLVSPGIYVSESMFSDVLVYGSGGMDIAETDSPLSEDADNNAAITDVADAGGKLTMSYGRLPKNAYEVILPVDMRDWNCREGDTIKGKVNGVNLKIVGFYKSSDENENRLFVTAETFYYKWISTSADITLCCTDREATVAALQEKNLNVRNNYDADRAVYMDTVKDSVRTTVILAAVIAAIALLEIYLILRSSFLSRIKEVGTLRAIGVKKGDIYCQFLGEILAITLLTSVPGFLIAGYVMRSLSQYNYFANLYAFNTQVVISSVGSVLIFQILVGLLPVFLTLRKTPAAILARTDVD